MNMESTFDIGKETSQLLARLDEALDRSGRLRDILRQRQKLDDIEAVTGSSGSSLRLRDQIDRREKRLLRD